MVRLDRFPMPSGSQWVFSMLKVCSDAPGLGMVLVEAYFNLA